MSVLHKYWLVTSISLALVACGGSTGDSARQPVASVLATTTTQSTFTVSIGWMGDLTSDGTFLYMSTMAASRPIIKIDPASGQVLATIEQHPFCTLSPRGMAFDGQGHLFLTSMTPTVCVFDTTGTLVKTFTVPDPVPNSTAGFRTGALAFDGTNVYVGDTDASKILVTDQSGNLIRFFDSGNRPDGMVFDPSTSHLWLVDLFATNQMSEISTTGELIRVCNIPYNAGPFGLGGIAILGSKFYVSQPLNPSSPGDGTTINVFQRDQLVCNPAIAPTPPLLSLPSNISADATSPAGALVTFTATAKDSSGAPLAVGCVPASGSTFAIGTTSVSCSATDSVGNTASGSFTVTVNGPATQATNLIATVQSFNLTLGTTSSLDAKLANAITSISAGSTASACNILGAFINEVQAQSGKKLSTAQASTLIGAATRISAAQGCP